MSRTRIRAAFVKLVAGRLAIRATPPGRRILGMFWTMLLVSVGAGAALLAGSSSLILAGLAFVGAIGLLATGCLRVFVPSLAVSVIGVALACASLMTAFSVTSGFERAIVSSVARLNGHVLLTKYGLDFFEYEDVARRWLDDPRVSAASPFAYSMVALVAQSSTADDEPSPLPVNALGKGIDPRFARDLEGIEEVMDRGDLSGLRPGDTRHVPGLILGRRLATALGAEVGDRVRVVVPAEIDGRDAQLGVRPPRHAEFEVLDLLETGVSDIDREVALMHITAAQALFFGEGRVTGIEFELADPNLADTVAREMEQRLGDIYRTATWRQTNAVLLVGLQQIRAALSLVLGLMVVVASASLIASLLLLVRRKRADIATFAALGGDARLAFWTFESIGLIAGLVGALLGGLMGGYYCLLLANFRYPLQSDVYPVDHLPVQPSVLDVLGPALVAVLLCALASGPVAALAAKVDILRGMKR